ncbi:MAG: hypothetical protein ABI555_00485 [Chloroflexota bacterium]
MTASETMDRQGVLVWVDARESVIVRWAGGEAAVERRTSDVPPRRRSTGHVRHDPGTRHGGGGSAPHDAGEGRRIEHLNRFVDQIAADVTEDDDVLLLGSGQVRELVASRLREADLQAHRNRQLTVEPAGRLTDPQLVARLRAHLLASPERVAV